ncbi:hypothetical protein [Bdellovibrio sp. NC01]|uniref:BP74-related protein n=1 Tax=Bdellovibrio sp. NC01 TaxID=2220073 RepID=UPI00115A8E70|nr:hypothetical protein [Bdellovibrio sp. NC01]QDK37681.1 hypothetical protein DOE51_08840 [Bdellovibrio sp. NC01]
MDKRLKTIIGVCSLSLLTTLSAQASQVFYAPEKCAPSELQLVLINHSTSELKAWTQVRVGVDIDEQEFDLEPLSKLKVAGEDFLKHSQSFSVKTPSDEGLQVILQCKDQLEVTLSSYTSPFITHELKSASHSVKVDLLNLYLKKNNVTLKAFSASNILVAEKAVSLENSYDTQSFKWIFESEATRIEVISEERINSTVISAAADVEVQSHAVVKPAARLPASDKKTYFLVSTRDKNPTGAFVIALDQTEQIATAREQIAHPELEKIVVATIALGSGGFNRSFTAKDKSPYSWSVAQVDNFADFAHIDCDGSPDLVEERLNRKLNEDARICFWRYRIIRELSPEEVRSGTLKNRIDMK